MVSQIFGASLNASCFEGKLLITSHVDGSSIRHRIPCSSPVMVINKIIPWGTVSIYGFLNHGMDDFLYLQAGEASWLCSINGSEQDLSPLILELCAGMGGMGIGASFLGGMPSLSIDSNELACCHLMANSHGKVLKLDINQAHSAKIIHQEFGGSPGTITFGFPCQPLSSQGMQLGSQDTIGSKRFGKVSALFFC